MDKITRLLLLYSKLMRGEKVNKLGFCMETDILPRTFDRDIEDVRLYLSELFCVEELVYDRKENSYYLLNTQYRPLEVMEYLFIERLLLDTGVLRNDEMDGILSHLAQNTENVGTVLFHEKECLKSYSEPNSKAPILKMNGDLQTIIKNKSVIEIRYTKMDGTLINRTVIPCMVKYDLGYLYLIAYRLGENDQYAAYFRLDRIYSFSVSRSQTEDEKVLVEGYIRNYSTGITQMYGGDYVEIVLKCNKNYYPYVYDKFRTVKIVSQESDVTVLEIKAFEDGFVKWILSQPVNQIIVLSPQTMKEKIAMESKIIFEKYTEVHE